MRTMASIDAFGYTMKEWGRSLATAAEYRERGEWIEARKANEEAERYRIRANQLRERIARKLGETDNTLQSFPNADIADKAA